MKLESKGLLIFEKDRNDARVTRLKMTEQSCKFWKKTQPKAIEFTEDVIKNIEK